MTTPVSSFGVSSVQPPNVATKNVKDLGRTERVSIDSQENSNSGNNIAIGAALTALASIGLYSASRGKSKSVINGNQSSVKTGINNLIRETEKNIANAENRFARQGARTMTTDRAVVEQIETINANNSSRKLVEQALADTPTEADIARYHENIKYKPANAKDVAAAKDEGVKFVEKEGANATQGVADAKGAEKLAEVVSDAPKGIKNGTYKVEYADGKFGTYTVQDGNIVNAEVPDVKPKNLFKHYAKQNILEQIAQGGSNVSVV